jgi:hypothetical protein
MILAGVCVYGDKKVGVRFIGNSSALFQRDEGIIGTREDDFRARQALLDNFAEAEGNVQAQIFLHQTGWADGAGVMAAVSRVNYDTSDFEAEGAGKRGLAVVSWLGGDGGLIEIRFGGGPGYFEGGGRLRGAN